MKAEDVVTFHDLARYIAEREGKKEELSIAQISEVLSIIREFIRDGKTKGTPVDWCNRANVVLGYEACSPRRTQEGGSDEQAR